LRIVEGYVFYPSTTTKITTEGPEFEMPRHYMKEVVASVKTKGQSQPVKTKK
jgi:hypothetical protein